MLLLRAGVERLDPVASSAVAARAGGVIETKTPTIWDRRRRRRIVPFTHGLAAAQGTHDHRSEHPDRGLSSTWLRALHTIALT